MSDFDEQEISDDYIRNFLCEAIEFLKDEKAIEKDQNVKLSIAIVSAEEIKKLNSEHRKKNESTDVLSFCYNEENDGKRGIEGEIVLCSEVIEKNSKEDKVSFKTEFEKNLAHGLLHILGYEHSDEMFSLQDKILSLK